MIDELTTAGELEKMHERLQVVQARHYRVGGTHTVELIAHAAPGSGRARARGEATAASWLEAHGNALRSLDEELAIQAHHAETLARLELGDDYDPTDEGAYDALREWA